MPMWQFEITCKSSGKSILLMYCPVRLILTGEQHWVNYCHSPFDADKNVKCTIKHKFYNLIICKGKQLKLNIIFLTLYMM